MDRPSAIGRLGLPHQAAQRLGAVAALDGDVAGPRHRPADHRDEQKLALQHDGGIGEQAMKAKVSQVD